MRYKLIVLNSHDDIGFNPGFSNDDYVTSSREDLHKFVLDNIHDDIELAGEAEDGSLVFEHMPSYVRGRTQYIIGVSELSPIFNSAIFTRGSTYDATKPGWMVGGIPQSKYFVTYFNSVKKVTKEIINSI